MKSLVVVLGFVGFGLGLSGCQTVQESQQSAEITCQNSGYRPGTAAYRRCVNANFQQNRANSDAAANAVAAGAAAGVVTGALVGAAVSDPYYYHRGYYYGGCGYYGCY
jgi:hypothetical protein